MCSIDDSEPWTVYREAHRVAAKPHTCVECGREIEPGERYLYATGLYEDRWSTYRMCAHCEVGADWLRAVCGGFSWHIVLEEVAGHWDEVWPRSLGLGRYVILSGQALTRNSVIRVTQWHRDGALVPVPKAIPAPVGDAA